MGISKYTKKVLATLVILLFLISAITYGSIHILFFKPLNNSLKESYIYIDRDDTIDSVFQKIKEEFKLPKSPHGFKILNHYKNYSTNIKTGKYAISSKDNSYSLFMKLFRGHQTPTRLVINNIRTLDQLASKVSSQLMLEKAELKIFFGQEENLSKLGYTYETLPALFIPNTYEVYWNMDVKDFISRMSKEHDRFWNKDRIKKAQEIGLTPIQVATLASIVEEETNDNSEKPIVAGLYLNRLKKDMLLQADPTIKFALQDFAIQRITNSDLKIDSPYNTYIYTGLPPGPIRFATIQGLESVLNYSQHNYLYMCAKDDFSGKHAFATNLREHMINARKYWRALNQRKIYK